MDNTLLSSQKTITNAAQHLQLVVGLAIAAVVVVLFLDPLAEEGADVAGKVGVGDLAEVDVLALAGLVDELLEALRNELVLVHQMQSSLDLLGAATKTLSYLAALSLYVQHRLLVILLIDGLWVDVPVSVL